MKNELHHRRHLRMGAVVLSGLFLLLLAVSGRLVYINTILRPKLLNFAAQQQAGASVLPARRGMILDVQRRVIAASRQLPDVFIDPTRVSDSTALIRDLSIRLNISEHELREKITKRADSRFVVVASRVDDVTADAVRSMRHPGVGLVNQDVRSYPLGGSMAHILGYAGRDGRGLEGVELAFDQHLAGKDGKRQEIRDARRRALLPAEPQNNDEPIDGGHVVLTIDAEVQRIVERAVQRAVTDFNAESGVGIVMSPFDGEILAMACYPTFDPNEGAPASGDLRRNRAITDPVEPGSTFKPFVASGALDARVLNSTEQIDCKMGTHFFGSRRVTDTHPHGLLNLKGVIAKSSNIGMTFIAERLGSRRLRETLRGFGFGERTGIELIGENPGAVYPLPMWTRGSIPSIAMGYEVLVTPLQLITAFSSLINDGVRIKPRLVKALLRPDGEVVHYFDGAETKGRAISTETARYMAHDLLASVVEEGTASRAKLTNYRVIGKTGTAKLTYKGRSGYEPGKYLSVFMGAAPADHPRAVVLVMVREPDAKQGYYGGLVAAPAVAEILRNTLPYLGVPPDSDPRVAEVTLD